MSDYKPIPVQVAESIASIHEKSIVIIFAWDPKHRLLHTTTYGTDPQNKAWAAQAGEIASKALGAVTDMKQTFEDYRLQEARKLLAALKDARERFHRCATHSGSDKDFVDIACAEWDKTIAEAEKLL